MRKSRTDTAETRQRIVAAASKMFLDHGIDGVGMRDVMANANLTLGGFYRHFESKEQLVAEANGLAFERIFTVIGQLIAGQSRAKALETIVSLYLNQSQDKLNTYLCPLAMIGAELIRGDEQARKVAFNGYQRFVQLIADHLPRQADSNAAGSIFSIMVGAVTLSNLAPDEAAARSILSSAADTIKHLSRPTRSRQPA